MEKYLDEYHDILCVPGKPDIGFLSIDDQFLVSEDGRRYSIINGIPQLIEGEEYIQLSDLYDNKSHDKNVHSAVGYWFPSHYRRMHNVFHQHFLNIPDGGIILDIGCGHGELTSKLTSSHKVYGLDISQSMLELAKANGLNPVRAGAWNIPFRNNSMDICVAAEMLQHISDMRKFFSEVYRILRPGGCAIISTISKRSFLRRTNRIIKGINYTDITVLREPNEVLYVAKNNGFSHISTTCIYWPFPISSSSLKADAEISSLATNFIIDIKK